MMIPPGDRNEQALDALFQSYRQATEFGDAGPNFMPALWQRIESRRRASFFIDRTARIFAASALALTVAAGLLVSLAPSRPDPETWVETLANHHLAQNTSYYEPVQLSAANDIPAASPSLPSEVK